MGLIEMVKEGLAMVSSYLWPIEANLAKSRLEADGIRCFIFNEEFVTVDWLDSRAVGGVNLFVKASDLERAREILNEKPLDLLEADDRKVSRMQFGRSGLRELF